MQWDEWAVHDHASFHSSSVNGMDGLCMDEWRASWAS